MDTADAALIETSNMDAFWGTARKELGRTMLGKLLMEVRDELRQDAK
jgi:predicted NAD-dependent protein-ADP-ribosyltransferase YbiA (DUF1768 family)